MATWLVRLVRTQGVGMVLKHMPTIPRLNRLQRDTCLGSGDARENGQCPTEEEDRRSLQEIATDCAGCQ